MRVLGLRGRPYPRNQAPPPSPGNRAECQESPESGGSSPCPPSTLGFGYHLYSHGGRLALPGRHHGSLLPEDCRLVYGSTALTTSLAIQAFERARRRRRPPPGLLYHSERGTQYTRHAFQSLLRQHGVQRSLSAKGNGFDNAAMESFFALLKRERVTRQRSRFEQALTAYDKALQVWTEDQFPQRWNQLQGYRNEARLGIEAIQWIVVFPPESGRFS